MRWEEGFWGDRVDPVVACIGRVGVYYPEGVEVCPEKGFLGGDVEGKDIIHYPEPREYRV